MSYTIDVYRGKLRCESNFLNFAVFVSFFPQLVAGPIVRAAEFLPQLRVKNEPTIQQTRLALLLIVQGLFKKIVVADLLAYLLVDDVFAQPGSFNGVDRLLALYGYAFQIYNDFSGYSDIALGSAALLGFRLPVNFDQPYAAQSVREFWSRWHMSLSTWLRDYLYIPLGGNRRGDVRTCWNLLATMAIGGLWHGAAWNFVLWGVYHGVLLMMHRVFKGDQSTKEGKKDAGDGFRRMVRVLVCFHLVLFGWLLFRIQNLGDLVFFTSDFTSQVPLRVSVLYLVLLALAISLHLIPQSMVSDFRKRTAQMPSPAIGLGLAACLGLFMACSVQSGGFIYFQF